ncbi:MAG: galactose mutarotase [Clostridia bacterium]|nr:galactose mutarotase [Clostridia bacterium]
MITQSIFGYTKSGEPVTAFRLANSSGACAVILDYGCILQALSVPNAQGTFTDVVLGYDTFAEYEENDAYLGAVIGRVANRIGKAEFTLNGKTYKLARNNGENHLHGGIKGFDKFIWAAEVKGNSLELSRVSPDGEEGYPGNLSVKVSYHLTEDNEFRISYEADTDADTILNLTNHSYFNLTGGGTVLNHELQVFAEKFTENDSGCLPTGKLLDAEGTPFDFSRPKALGRDIEADNEQLSFGRGYDHNFVLSDTSRLKKAAVLHSSETGMVMTTLTTLPGLQVYSSNFLTQRKGKNGGDIDRRYALCLETQIFPNAMACLNFPSPVLRAGEHFHTETVYRFETK